MEVVTRAFKEFFKQLDYRKCSVCGTVHKKALLFKRNGSWICRECADPKYKAFIQSVGV